MAKKSLLTLIGTGILAAAIGVGYVVKTQRDQDAADSAAPTQYFEYSGEIPGYSVRIDETIKGKHQTLMAHLTGKTNKVSPYWITGHDFDGLGENKDDWEKLFISSPSCGMNCAVMHKDGTWDYEPCNAEKDKTPNFTPDQINQAKQLLKSAINNIYTTAHRRDFQKERQQREEQEKQVKQVELADNEFPKPTKIIYAPNLQYDAANTEVVRLNTSPSLTTIVQTTPEFQNQSLDSPEVSYNVLETIPQLDNFGQISRSMLIRSYLVDASIDQNDQPSESRATASTASEELHPFNPKISLSGDHYFVSDSVANVGTRWGKGPLMNTSLSANAEFDNLTLSGFTWTNYSIPDGKNMEQDFGITAKLKLSENFSINAGPQYWEYGSGSDFVVSAGIDYSKDNWNVGFKALHLVEKDGTIYILTAGKKFPIENTKFTVTPNIKTVYADNYYGTNGWLYVTPGVDLGLGKLGPLDVKAFIKYQKSLGADPIVHDILYGGIGFEFATEKRNICK